MAIRCRPCERARCICFPCEFDRSSAAIDRKEFPLAAAAQVGDTGASYTIATAGTYIISIKYDTKSIAGTTAPTSDPITYTFKATPPGATSSASVLLKKQ